MSKTFNYKENDIEGLEILDVISDAEKFNKWMYDTIVPYCDGEILEIGSGIGNISKLFLENQRAITVSDIREIYTDKLRTNLTHYSTLKNVVTLDLVSPDFSIKYAHLLGSFDSIFALNVVEHIEDDILAIANCKLLLKNKGKLIILVPAYQSLYNAFDTELFHFRRYTKKSLKSLFVKNKMQIVRANYFNAAGIFGWFISGKLQKNRSIPSNQMRFFNKLVPLFKLVDRILLNKIGLSVVIVGEK